MSALDEAIRAYQDLGHEDPRGTVEFLASLTVFELVAALEAAGRVSWKAEDLEAVRSILELREERIREALG